MPSAPAVTISPSGATATALSGVGNVATIGDAAPPSGQMRKRRVIAGGDQRAAVGRKRHAVDVLRVALEDARRAARERPQPRGAVPRRRGERARRRARPPARQPAPCGLRAPFDGCCSPGCQIAMRASSPLVAMRPSLSRADRIDRAIMKAQHLLGRVTFAATSGSPTYRSCPRPLSCRRAISQARAPARHGRATARAPERREQHRKHHQNLFRHGDCRDFMSQCLRPRRRTIR